jgi:hypothetical protein
MAELLVKPGRALNKEQNLILPSVLLVLSLLLVYATFSNGSFDPESRAI